MKTARPVRGVPSPFPYQGSKRRQAATILEHLPRCGGRLVEPFAGSGAVSLAAVAAGRAEQAWLNDGHRELAALWCAIRDNPRRLAGYYADLWCGQIGREAEFYKAVRRRFNEAHGPDDYLYLLNRVANAAVRFNSRGDFNGAPDIRRRGAGPAVVARRLTEVAFLVRDVHVTGWDYTAVLAEANEDDVLYLDPPYQGVTGPVNQRYRPAFDHAAFRDELEQLNRRGMRYLLSYDGRTGNRAFGDALPAGLNLRAVEITTGPSSQATLLGRTENTVEMLYLSPACRAG